MYLIVLDVEEDVGILMDEWLLRMKSEEKLNSFDTKNKAVFGSYVFGSCCRVFLTNVLAPFVKLTTVKEWWV